VGLKRIITKQFYNIHTQIPEAIIWSCFINQTLLLFVNQKHRLTNYF